MPGIVTELEKTIIEGAVDSFDAFCEDIAGMFGIGSAGTASGQQLVTLKELKSDFKKLTAVYIVEGKGVVNGDFYIILDQDALFTLAGTFVMLPEKVIIQNRRTGKEKEADEIADAVGEVGNLLVGAWDKHFREEIEGHVHLLQTGTFIGKPWLKPEENIGLAKETELVAVKYEMSIEPFEPFICMAAFPKQVFEVATPVAPEEEPAEEPKAEEPAAEAAPAEEPKTEKPAAEAAPAEEPKTEKPAAEAAPVEESKTEKSAEETVAETPAETVAETPEEERPVSKIIEQMTQSSAILPGEIAGDFLTNVKATNVMRTDIAWATQDETVEAVLTKMQQQNTGYALIGSPAAIEGIVSKSDIQGALSPYLQAIFSKWKRELDTATLQIKVRWIMSRPVHTVRPDATLSVIMDTMCKHSVRALPVADENGTCGIVTAYTIFNALGFAGEGEVPQKSQNTDVPALS